jgi:purine-cytosine permease-like protein
VQAADVGIVRAAGRTQTPFDLFLIFAGANIVATTLQTGAALVPAFSFRTAAVLVVAGGLFGALLVAALSPLGPRLGVPSVVAARAALGFRGAAAVALLLYVSNFAWIAVNNVIAASACARVFGGPGSERAWAVGLGLLATAIAAGGPRAVGLADRVAVPLLLVVGVLFTVAVLRLPAGVVSVAGDGSIPWPRGLDVVIGYQASWLLMFADYSRYTASPGRGALAVFCGLGLTSVWFMPLGFAAARAAKDPDPGAMLAAVGLGASGALLLTLATLTTNFVNLYLSALAWKSLVPKAPDHLSIWSIGVVGATLSLFQKGWLDRYADFMIVIGALMVPVGGVLLSHFFLRRSPVRPEDLYERDGPYAGFAFPGVAAWAAGAVAYFVAAPIGGTLPSLATAIAVHALLARAPRRTAQR